MAKNIQTGIEKLVSEKSTFHDLQLKQHEQAWRDIRNKLDSILLSTNSLKSNEVRKMCQKLDLMNPSERYEFINANFGVLYASRSLPLLQQLEMIETTIAKLKAT